MYFLNYCIGARILCYKFIYRKLFHNFQLLFESERALIKNKLKSIEKHLVFWFVNHSDQIKWFGLPIQKTYFFTTDCYKNPVSFVDKLYSFIHITHQLPFVAILSLPLWTFKTQIFNFCELRGEKRVYCNIFRKRMRGIKDMGYTFIFNKRRHSRRPAKATDPNIFYLFINAFSKTCIRKYCKKFLFLKSKMQIFCLGSASYYKNFCHD